MDFGPGHSPLHGLKRFKPGESPDRGPFQKIRLFDRFLRFAAENALLLVVFAGALFVVILYARREGAR